MQKLFDQLRIEDIVSDDNFTEKLFEPLSSLFEFFFGHFEEETFLGQDGYVMIAIFESIVEVIKFGESLFDVPFVVPDFELHAEEDGSFFGFVFGEGGDADFDG